MPLVKKNKTRKSVLKRKQPLRKQNKHSHKRNQKRNQKGGNKNTSVNVTSKISPNQQWDSPDSKSPEPTINGGLYTGEAGKAPWGAIPVTPTTANYMNNNL